MDILGFPSSTLKLSAADVPSCRETKAKTVTFNLLARGGAMRSQQAESEDSTITCQLAKFFKFFDMEGRVIEGTLRSQALRMLSV